MKFQTESPQTPAEGKTVEQIINRWREMNVKISRYLYDSPAAVAQLCEMFDSALRNEREACAKVADERAAFNRRLAATHKIGDPMADLKHTRADEDEIVANEIRSGEGR